MPDFIPNRDNDLLIWSTGFANWCAGHGVAKGLTLPQISELTDAVGSLTAVIGALSQQRAALDATIQSKQAIRANIEALVRRYKVILEPNLSPAERLAAGFPGRAAGRAPVRPPETRPIARIDPSRPLVHVLRFTDSATPTRRAKPKGVRHAEVWLKIGDPKPTGPAEARLVGVASATSFQMNFEGADAGKMAHYLIRWASTRNQPGPWSEVHSATIGGV